MREGKLFIEDMDERQYLIGIQNEPTDFFERIPANMRPILPTPTPTDMPQLLFIQQYMNQLMRRLKKLPIE
jgi:hypothetical protein